MSDAAVGIDRCRGGWVVASATANDPIELSLFESIPDVLAATHNAPVVAIDMPLALPVSGRRPAEAELRQFLKSAARSVFDSPTRAALNAASRAEAQEINRARGGVGISAQAWGLSGPIREARSALAGHDDQRRWWETHPETAFALMAGDGPLESKKTALGVGQRLALLRPVFGEVDQLLLEAPAKVPVDDVLDALAALWSARRVLTGEAHRFGPEGRDDEGFPIGVLI